MEKHIHSELMMEIFCRLPARSVGRFRSVSKLYYRLLSQPLFMKDHLLHGGVNSSVKLLVELIELNYRKKTLMYYPFSSFDKSLTLDGSVVQYPSYPNPGDNVSLLGTCNGLFCLEDITNNRVVLWNPTTRVVYCLPELPDNVSNNNSGKGTTYDYGLGYDSLNDDYKVVCVMCVSNHNVSFLKIPSTTKTYIYSHRSRCWKEIQPFPHYTINGNPQFVHNKFHWIPYRSQDGIYSQVIVSLDLATERYGTVPQPNYYPRPAAVFSRKYGTDPCHVCVLGGELGVCINYRYELGFHVWRMREYGVKKSWCRLLSIPSRNLVFSLHQGMALCLPFFLMESGEILLQAFEDMAASIYSYSPRTRSFVTVHSGSYLALCTSAYTYVESLVELK